LKLKDVQNPGAEMVKVNFSILEERESAEMFTNPQTGQKESTSRMHVVWDVDLATASGKEWDAEGYKVSRTSRDAVLNEETDTMKKRETMYANSTLSQINAEIVLQETQNANQAIEDVVEEPQEVEIKEFHFFDEEDRVEYWSTTHKKWVTAKIIKSMGLDSDNKDCYNLVVGAAGQLRYMVPVDNLRLPLKASETVSVYSSKDSTWLQGEIDGTPHLAATTMGYNVRIIGESSSQDEFIPNAPAARIRRRFMAGNPVDVFMGAKDGFASGKVAATAESRDASHFKGEDNRVLSPKASTATMATIASANFDEERVHQGPSSLEWLDVRVILAGTTSEVVVPEYHLRIQQEWLQEQEKATVQGV